METNVPATQDVSEKIQGHANRAVHGAADRLHQAAAALRDRVGEDSETKVTRFASGAAQAIDQAATYVDGVSLTQLKNDASGIVRRYPMQSLAVGMGLGFLVARMIRR